MSTQRIGRCGELLVHDKLLKLGIESAAMTTDAGVDLVAFPFVRLQTARVKCYLAHWYDEVSHALHTLTTPIMSMMIRRTTHRPLLARVLRCATHLPSPLVVLVASMLSVLPAEDAGAQTSSCNRQLPLVGCFTGEDDRRDYGESGTRVGNDVLGAVNMAFGPPNSIAIRACAFNRDCTVIETFSGPWMDLTNRVSVVGCRSLRFVRIRKNGVYNRFLPDELSYVIVEFLAESRAKCSTPFEITFYRPGPDGRTVFRPTMR